MVNDPIPPEQGKVTNETSTTPETGSKPHFGDIVSKTGAAAGSTWAVLNPDFHPGTPDPVRTVPILTKGKPIKPEDWPHTDRQECSFDSWSYSTDAVKGLSKIGSITLEEARLFLEKTLTDDGITDQQKRQDTVKLVLGAWEEQEQLTQAKNMQDLAGEENS